MDHKHLPEMARFAGLEHEPLFTPMVAGYYKGMVVYVPLSRAHLDRPVDANDVREVLAERYADEPCVQVAPTQPLDCLDEGYLDPEAANDTNRVDLMVFGSAEQVLIAARLDNLGKGAAGAAVQNLNLMLGQPELEGLIR